MMKLRKKIILFLLVSTLIYFFLIPKGSVRFSIIRSGHPIKALTSKISEETFNEEWLKNYKFYTVNPAPENATGITGFWKTSQFGPFYWTSHAGMP